MKTWNQIVMEKQEAGYDLCDMKASDFAKILEFIGAKVDKNLKPVKRAYRWVGKDVTIVTSNNPFNGESTTRPEKEKDYLGYVGVFSDMKTFDFYEVMAMFDKFGASKDFNPRKAYFID